MENFFNLVKILSEGLGTTLLIFTLTLLLGIPAGILVAMARNSKNKIISNITMNYKIKYLWIKNIYDEAGNGLCDSEYCVYDLDIKRNNYSVSYYDEDRKNMKKKIVIIIMN